jgi:hypothetical protein
LRKDWDFPNWIRSPGKELAMSDFLWNCKNIKKI